MKKCPYCGIELLDDVEKCQSCGRKQGENINEEKTSAANNEVAAAAENQMFHKSIYNLGSDKLIDILKVASRKAFTGELWLTYIFWGFVSSLFSIILSIPFLFVLSHAFDNVMASKKEMPMLIIFCFIIIVSLQGGFLSGLYGCIYDVVRGKTIYSIKTVWDYFKKYFIRVAGLYFAYLVMGILLPRILLDEYSKSSGIDIIWNLWAGMLIMLLPIAVAVLIAKGYRISKVFKETIIFISKNYKMLTGLLLILGGFTLLVASLFITIFKLMAPSKMSPGFILVILCLFFFGILTLIYIQLIYLLSVNSLYLSWSDLSREGTSIPVIAVEQTAGVDRTKADIKKSKSIFDNKNLTTFVRAIEIAIIVWCVWFIWVFVFYRMRGYNHYLSENYEQALHYWLQEATIRNNCKVSNNIALCYKNLWDYDNEEIWCKKSIAYEPNFTKAHYNLSECYRFQGKNDLALEEYKKLLTLTPNDSSVCRKIMYLYFYNSDIKSAKKQYYKFVKQEPPYLDERFVSEIIKEAKFPAVISVIATEIKGQKPAGAEHLYLAGDRQLFCWSFNLGYSLPKNIKHIWCYNGYEMSEIDLNLSKRYERTWSSITINKDLIGKWKVKVMDLNDNLIDTKTFEVGKQAGYKCDKKENELVLDYLNKQVEANPNDSNAYLARGKYYLKKKDYEKSLSDYAELVKLNPKDTRTYCSLGKIYALKKEYKAAVDNFNKAIKLDPKSSGAYFQRGITYVMTGEYDKAIVDNSKVIELDPVCGEAFSNRGYVYFDKDDYNNAFGDFNTAREINPKSWDAFLGMAITCFKKNDIEQAKKYLKQALDIEPCLKDGITGIDKMEKQDYYWTEKQKRAIKELYNNYEATTKFTNKAIGD